eukprot:TRINITY_DN35759_c0_g1_i1.p1 TRINITY_DN35759_c0_g1~~TRINITY_DN35759_c0_g1_i1.p1  ORF type:complete len:130 (+),score=7.00 TRINITY_DN35759_c0_g1_i1:167-556(+)
MIEAALQSMLRRSNGKLPIICDICDKNVKITDSVWVCENGNSTVLHALSYDVCNHCFLQYALNTNSGALPTSSTPMLEESLEFVAEAQFFEPDGRELPVQRQLHNRFWRAPQVIFILWALWFLFKVLPF